jgi:hypothetical protein
LNVNNKEIVMSVRASSLSGEWQLLRMTVINYLFSSQNTNSHDAWGKDFRARGSAVTSADSEKHMQTEQMRRKFSKSSALVVLAP